LSRTPVRAAGDDRQSLQSHPGSAEQASGDHAEP
jgi:hypothetical protein